MLTPGEIWPMIAASAAVVFGAGQLVEKVRNGKYMPKDVCAQVHMRVDERLQRIDKNLDRIWRRLDGKLAQEEGEE